MKQILILIIFLLINTNTFAENDQRSKEIIKYLEQLY